MGAPCAKWRSHHAVVSEHRDAEQSRTPTSTAPAQRVAAEGIAFTYVGERTGVVCMTRASGTSGDGRESFPFRYCLRQGASRNAEGTPSRNQRMLYAPSKAWSRCQHGFKTGCSSAGVP
jgi:hypothetical protein